MIEHMGDAALPPDLMRMIRDLERRLREAIAGRRLESAEIGAGVVRVTGGRIEILSEDLTALVAWLGTGPTGLRGWALHRHDGTPVFRLFPGGEDQFWELLDVAGNRLVSDDAVTGTGLARPYLPVHWRDVSVPYKSTTSGSFSAIFDANWQVQHPRIKVTLQVNVPAGTTGEWELRTAGGTVLATHQATQSEFFDLIGTAVTAEVNVGSEVTLEVRHRRVSGAGTVETRLLDSHGIQS